jgi:hypothetical protein
MFNLQICCFSDRREGELPELRLLHLFDDGPVRLDRNGRLALLDLHRTVVVLAAALLLLPLTHLTLAFPKSNA